MGVALVLVAACAGGGSAAPVAPRAAAPVTVEPPPAGCRETAALEAEARRQLADGRALGALTNLDRIPNDCVTDKSRALERRVKAVLAPPGHSQVEPRELFARAVRERAAGHDKRAHVLDSRAGYALELRTGKSVALEPWDHIESAGWSPDGRLVAVRASGFVDILDAASGREVCRIKGHDARFSPDSRFLLTSRPQRLVDIAGCEVRLEFDGFDQALFSPHSRYLFAPIDDMGVLFDLATLKVVRRIPWAFSNAYMGFSKSGRYLAMVVNRYGVIFTKVADLASGRIWEHKSNFEDFIFLPDERHIAVQTPAHAWTIEDLTTGRVRKLSTRGCPGVGDDSPVFSGSGRYVAIGGGPGKMCILETRTLHLVHRIKVSKSSPDPHGKDWRGEAFLGDRVLSITNGLYSRVYSLPSGSEILHGAYRLVTRNGNYLVFGGRFDPPHATKVDTAVVARDGSVRYLSVGPDNMGTRGAYTLRPDRGRVLLRARKVEVLDVKHARVLGQHEWDSFAELGPAGKRVLSTTRNRVEIWNASTGALEKILLGTFEPRAVAFDGATSLRMLDDSATRYTISAAPKGGASASAAPGCHDIAVDLAHGLAVGTDATGHLAVCRLGSGRILARRPKQTPAPTTLADFSHDGNRVLVSGKPASLWDWRKNRWTRLGLTAQSGAAFGSGDRVAVFDGNDTVHLVNVRSGKIERSVPRQSVVGAKPLYLDAGATYLVVGGRHETYGIDLQEDSRAELGGDGAAAAMDSHGVIALTANSGVEFSAKSGNWLGSLKVWEATRSARGPVTAMWQDSSGAVEISGDRTPLRSGVACRIGTMSVPVELCFEVLERSGVARRILEGKPPIDVPLRPRSGRATP